MENIYYNYILYLNEKSKIMTKCTIFFFFLTKNIEIYCGIVKISIFLNEKSKAIRNTTIFFFHTEK